MHLAPHIHAAVSLGTTVLTCDWGPVRKVFATPAAVKDIGFLGLGLLLGLLLFGGLIDGEVWGWSETKGGGWLVVLARYAAHGLV